MQNLEVNYVLKNSVKEIFVHLAVLLYILSENFVRRINSFKPTQVSDERSCGIFIHKAKIIQIIFLY